MGRTIITRGHHNVLYITIVACLLLLGCTTILKFPDSSGGQEKLSLAQKLFELGDFSGSLRHNQEIINLPEYTELRDNALFNSALIYAHSENPEWNYEISADYLRQLMREHPDSPLADQSKIWAQVLNETVRLKASSNARAAAEHALLLGQELATRKNFSESVKVNSNLLSQSAETPYRDRALFNIALIYAHYNNPEKDYNKSVHYFQRLIKEFPDSLLSEESKIWIDVLSNIEKAKQVDMEIEMKKKEMTQ